MRPLHTHALALLAGIGGATAIFLAPPVFTGPTPPETPGMTCVPVKTGVLTGEQVCTFGFVNADGGMVSAPAFPAPPETTLLPVDVDGGTMDAPVPSPVELPTSVRRPTRVPTRTRMHLEDR